MFVNFEGKHVRGTVKIVAHEKSPVLSSSCICDGNDFLLDEIVFGRLAPFVQRPVLAFLFRGVDELGLERFPIL